MKPLIELSGISRVYQMGSVEVNALKNIDLTIHAGEFVAIMGHSGSGKSTLLNLLGFLDRPDSGSYKLTGRETSGFSEDELSRLRSSTAGFVFQQFHLLPRMSVLDNTMLPMIYSGNKAERKIIARSKITEVGLEHRISHSPAELSGGEQQRVAIARSMVNDPLILFADEPTGNLDTKNEKEILGILKELNSTGTTVVMVTHETDVARYADRIITMKDGEIISDTGKKPKKRPAPEAQNISLTSSKLNIAEFINYMRQAVTSLAAHKMRSFLSMLGILIGVASVITMMGIGKGAQESIEKRLASLGSNVLSIRPGAHHARGVSLETGSVTRLTVKDAEALEKLPEVKATSPVVSGRGQVVAGNKNWNTMINGVGIKYESIRSTTPLAGRFFTRREVAKREKKALLGITVVKELFPDTNPIGKSIKINRVNFTVIGILNRLGSSPFRDRDDIILIPVTTAMYRLLGEEYVHSIEAEIAAPELIEPSKESIARFLKRRHNIRKEGDEFFHIRDMTEIREAISGTSKTIAMLLGIVAVISLIVGGIGIMNIMLVTVKERTREIGLRKAIGARRRDILMQFLIESALLTGTGGLAGITAGALFSALLATLAKWAVYISPFAVVVATFFSVIVGLFFGLWPAIQASRLKPVEALRYE